MKIISRLTLNSAIAMAAVLLAFVADPANAVMVKPSVEVDGPFIRLSDVLVHEGDVADRHIALSPEPGGTVNLQLHVIETAMRKAGMAESSISGNGYITVRRKGQEIPQSLLETLVENAIRAKFDPLSQMHVRMTGVRGSLYLPTDSDMRRIRIEGLEHDPRSNRFSAEIVAPYDQDAQLRTRINGIAEPVMTVPVLARSLDRGEVVSSVLIDWISLPERRVGRTIILDADALTGMEALRPLKAGQPLRAGDLRRPLLVEKGTLVTMIVQHGALSLSATGKAMQDGSKGDFIRLMNISTNRMIEARVTGAGTVSVVTSSTIASR